MFNIPSLADTMRVTDNRRRYSSLTNTNPFTTNWMAAEQRGQGMMPPQLPAPVPMGRDAQAAALAGMGNEAGQNYLADNAPMTPMAAPVADPFAPGDAARDAFRRGGTDDPFSRKGMNAPAKFSMGGEVEGAGGPKDDKIPAMLSDGEFIMPAEAVRFYGVDKLNKMRIKAMEGLEEIPDGRKDEGGRMKDEGMMMPGSPSSAFSLQPSSFSSGGMVRKYADGGMPNPLAEDERIAMMQPAAPVPVSVPVMATPAAPAFDPYAPQNIMGPPAAPPPTVEDMKFRGLAARAALDNQSAISNPPSTFLAPWEKRDAERAARQAENLPGMNRTQTRRFLGTPQGQQHVQRGQEMAVGQQNRAVDMQREDAMNAAKMQQDAQDRSLRMAEFQQRSDYYKRQAAAGDVEAQFKQAQFNLDTAKFQAEQSNRTAAPQPIEGTDYVRTPYGNLPKSRGAAEVPPGMEADSVVINGVRYKKPAAVPAGKTPGIKEVDGQIYNIMPDGSLKRAVIEDPSPIQKKNAFKALYGRDPKTESDHTEAYYLASGKPRPAAGAAAPAAKPSSKIKSATEVK